MTTTKTETIEITLTSAHMGDVDELDFELWAEFVADHIDALGLPITVIAQLPFGEPGDDVIWGATPEQRDAIRSWLRVDGWNAFCGEAWERMRAEAEAAA